VTQAPAQRPPSPSEPLPAGVASGRSAAQGSGRRLALLVFLLSPLFVLALLTFLIFQAQKSGPRMNEPPVGAGAGHTGMYNEYGGLRPGGKSSKPAAAKPGETKPSGASPP
jgi:hypothetical protein